MSDPTSLSADDPPQDRNKHGSRKTKNDEKSPHQSSPKGKLPGEKPSKKDISVQVQPSTSDKSTQVEPVGQEPFMKKKSNQAISIKKWVDSKIQPYLGPIDWFTGCVLITLIGVFLWICSMLYFSDLIRTLWSSGPIDPVLSPYERFTGQITQLKQDMPHQNDRLWRTLKASARHILKEGPSKYPAVILMAHHTADIKLASCLARKIASAYETSFKLTLPTVDIDMEELQNLDAAEQKKKLDTALDTAFKSSGQKSFIIHNLQSLKPEAALLLHGYCDNDYAPYKDVMLILVLQVDEETSSLDPNRPRTAEKYLETLWLGGLHKDRVKPILSRVANNIVIVTHEDQYVCKASL